MWTQHLIFPTDVSGSEYPRQSRRFYVSHSLSHCRSKTVLTFLVQLSGYIHQDLLLTVEHQQFLCLLFFPSSLCSIFHPLMYSQCVKTLKIFARCFAFLDNPSSCFRKFRSNVMILYISELCWEIGAKMARMGSSRSSRLVSYNLPLCSTSPKNFTNIFFRCV